MFAWYRGASRCYVYLADTSDSAARLNGDGKVDKEDPFRRSKWFTRGWTLQELLAPQNVVFFSANWVQIGTKTELKTPLSQITGVEAKYLTGSTPIWLASVSKRMSWMSRRVTTRVEDIAYCMLGIFDIHMNLRYGEGPHAFHRLQEKIIKVNDDQSIFCWEWNRTIVADDWASILAPCPAVFGNSGEFFPTAWDDNSDVTPYRITNAGLSIKLPLIQTANSNFVCAVLQVRQEWVRGNGDDDYPYHHQICIPLEKARIHRRLPFPTMPFPLHMAMAGSEKNIYIVSKTRSPESSRGYVSISDELLTCLSVPSFDAGFLLTFQHMEHEPFMTEVCHCTIGVLFMERQSVLAFSFRGSSTAQTFAAGILNVTHRGVHKFMVLLAVRLREAADGSHSFKFYCQITPRYVLERQDKSGHFQLPNTLLEAERSSMHIEHDVDFSRDGDATVALGDVIHYASSHEGYRQVLRVVHIASGDMFKSAALKEDTDSSISLFTS